ncbi:hypothetical protein PV10_06558 [Exophiala mesophila]|uniref:Uncharacterized protein n=1 Tax=Exophiala mesophila TaxID=212818 RepID=A0A0D1XV24_EXOME|nr:uncharacterized protein PV10_06558 [Exophiala mesophila]KIV92091.1 hypothetical protein PV10_06558 [Exophiala mesophila]
MFAGFEAASLRTGSASRPSTPFPTRAPSPVLTEPIPERTTPRRRRNTVGGCTSTSITRPDQVLLLRPRHDNESAGPVHNVGPWPLRRNGSSSTTVVTRNGHSDTPETYTNNLEQTNSEFSQLMRDIDRQYDEIRKLVQERTFNDMGQNPDLHLHLPNPDLNPFHPFTVPRVVTDGQGQSGTESRRFSEDGVTVFDENQDENRLEVSIETGGDGDHIRCRQCEATVKMSGQYASGGLVVLGLCFIVVLALILIMLKIFCPQGKVVLDSLKGGNGQTKSLFLGLLMVAVLATATPFAIATTLLLELQRTKRSRAKRSRKVLIFRGGSILVWYAIMVFCWMIAFMSFSVVNTRYADPDNGM